jgi:hypothetical protein
MSLDAFHLGLITKLPLLSKNRLQPPQQRLSSNPKCYLVKLVLPPTGLQAFVWDGENSSNHGCN